MEIIFIIGALVFLSAIVLLYVYILNRLANSIALEHLTFKKTFIFLFVWWLGTTIVSMPINFLLGYSMSYLVNIVVGFGIFYILINKFNRASLARSLKLFVLFSVTTTVISMVLVILVKGYIFSPFMVSGVSMNSTFETGDYLVIKRFGSDYARGDVVVYEQGQGEFLIHRVVGLPGEKVRIENGNVVIDGDILDEPYAQGLTSWEEKALILRKSEYFLMGDNREYSNDSRFTGAVSEDRIFGEYLTKIGLLSTTGWVN